MRLRRYSLRTEVTYLDWPKRFILFSGKRHPRDMGESEVVAFLTDLAVTRQVAASTHSQALCALLFLYADVLERPLGKLLGLERVSRPARVPTVLTRPEAHAVLQQLEAHPSAWLPAALLYGAGLRVMECLRLRVKDVDLERRVLTVRAGKGNKDRRAPLPERVVEPMRHHLFGPVRQLWEADVRQPAQSGVHLLGRACHQVSPRRVRVGLAVGVPFG